MYVQAASYQGPVCKQVNLSNGEDEASRALGATSAIMKTGPGP